MWGYCFAMEKNVNVSLEAPGSYIFGLLTSALNVNIITKAFVNIYFIWIIQYDGIN